MSIERFVNSPRKKHPDVTSAGLVESDDSFAAVMPRVVGDSVMERFPGFLIWAVRTTGAEGNEEHEVTVFDPRSASSHGRRTDDSMSHTRTTLRRKYHRECHRVVHPRRESRWGHHP